MVADDDEALPPSVFYRPPRRGDQGKSYAHDASAADRVFDADGSAMRDDDRPSKRKAEPAAILPRIVTPEALEGSRECERRESGAVVGDGNGDTIVIMIDIDPHMAALRGIL